ncbi:MAG: hypothetical protein LC126_12645 [Bryobacterales bacterium]|nr:hypothetical protein [Bryobacterales bacterium]
MPEFDSQRVVRQFIDSEHYDSSLWAKDRNDGGNLCATLRIKVHMRAVEMKNGPCTGYYQEEDDRFGAGAWDRMLWEAWQREYKSVIEDFWAWKYWLITPDDYDKLDEAYIRPNIRCHLDIEMVPHPGGAHVIFNVIRVADYRVNRMFTGGPGFTGWLADVGRGSDPDSEARLMLIDDVAHLFSMPHEGREFTNLNRYFRMQTAIIGTGALTYKGHGAHMADNLIGPVHTRQVWHALPWQKAMEKHTGVLAEDWKVVTKRVPPKKLEKKPA